MRDPDGGWDDVAITTYGDYGNFTVRDDAHRYTIYADGSEEFYDLGVDPNEWNNLAADPRYAELKARLAARLPAAKTHAPPVIGKDELI